MLWTAGVYIYDSFVSLPLEVGLDAAIFFTAIWLVNKVTSVLNLWTVVMVTIWSLTILNFLIPLKEINTIVLWGIILSIICILLVISKILKNIKAKQNRKQKVPS